MLLRLFALAGLLVILLGFIMLADAKSVFQETAGVISAGSGLITAAVATTGLVLRSELRSLRELIIERNTQANR